MGARPYVFESQVRLRAYKFDKAMGMGSFAYRFSVRMRRFVHQGECSTEGPARVVVIGGGVGGLTAALALSKCGFEPVVVERAPERHERGAGSPPCGRGISDTSPSGD